MKNTKTSNAFHESRAWDIVFGILVILLLLLAYRNSFIQDDAFISFRYAFNLADAHELTWNPGEERIEGYTNFLWTLLVAIPIALNIDPVPASKILGLLFAFGTLLCTHRLAFVVLQSRFYALLAVALLGTNYSFSAYATGGLETQMQTLLVVSSTLLAFSIAGDEQWRPAPLAGFSLLCAAGLLTRLDTAIPLAILLGFVLWTLTGRPGPVRQKLSAAALMLVPAALIIGSWLIWKYAYYGSILPNTYYVKASFISAAVLKTGVIYFAEFLRSYFLIPFVFLAAAFIPEILAQSRMRILSGIVVLWCLYVLRLGGDFMEFRFLVPILPFSFILIAGLIRMLNGTKTRIALVAMVFFGSLTHAALFSTVHQIESVRELQGHLLHRDENWIRVGRVLRELFPSSEDRVKIATTAAGAIPYYSQLPAVDMQGLNDKWIARNAIIHGNRPEGRQAPPVDYLVKQGVNLVIGHPRIQRNTEIRQADYSLRDLERFMIGDITDERIPKSARVIDFPLDSDYAIPVLYLVPNKQIDKVLSDGKLATHGISRR
jgi:arabinofuranosyltransferase